MIFNFQFYCIFFTLTVSCNIIYDAKNQDPNGIPVPEWQQKIEDKIDVYNMPPHGLYGSMDFVDAHDENHPRTSIVYLDATVNPLKDKKLSKLKKRKRKNKKRNKKLYVLKKNKKAKPVPGWRTFQQTKVVDSSGLSAEAKKRKPVDIIVHIKMKE